jgi:protein-S-isoprenylcysteine O-methyltransferase Ste14
MKRRRIDPSYFNLFIILSPIMHLVLPIRIIIHPPLTYFGSVIIVAAVTLNASAVVHLRRKLTPVRFGHSPRILVTDGPYRIGRNPIYLSAVVLLLGVAGVLGSLVTLVFPVVLFLLLDRIYIPDEEILMEREFGPQYLRYKRAVRRWL